MTYNFYKPDNSESIYEYSKGMIGKTFNDIFLSDQILVKETHDKEAYASRKRKGGLGELVEEVYFKIESNNESRPDFEEAGVELKVTPYKINKNGSLSSKERMIITMINYFDLIETDFYESGLWSKCQLILMVFYLWEKEVKDRLDYRIDYTYLYRPPKEDLKIIIDDYNLIKKKVLKGEAHNLSEGDTMYLGAATKASSSKDRRKQPNSEILAKPRAFSFKNSYMTYILNEYVVKTHKKELEKIIDKDNNRDEIKKSDSFEDFIINKINENVGMTDQELVKKYLNLKDTDNVENILKSNKAIYSNLAFRMLGVRSNRAEEFEKANIKVKSIRLENDGKIIESMSFPSFVIRDLVEERWEESDLYNYFESTKFLFVIYKKNKDRGYYFKKAVFWNMPMDIIDSKLKEDWENIVSKFKKGVNLRKRRWGDGFRVENDLPKKKDLNLIHVRPHAQKGIHVIAGKKIGNGDPEKDGDLLPNGDIMTRQCFWLNNDYLEDLIDSLL